MLVMHRGSEHVQQTRRRWTVAVEQTSVHMVSSIFVETNLKATVFA